MRTDLKYKNYLHTFRDSATNWTVSNGNIDSHHYFSDSCTYVPPPPASWDCVGSACIDSGNGTGMYTTLAACQAVCGVSAIEEEQNTKELISITDILGKESKPKPNTPLFYRYNDGTVEKKLIIE